MSEVLEVQQRDALGKLNNRRLRRQGKMPAVLYGHGKDPLSLAVPAEQLDATIRHGAKVVELKGAADGQALLQDVQWDVFQQHVLHVDLLRVEASDRVKVEVPLSLRGEAPGESEGGVLEHVTHFVEIETSPASIPDGLHVCINELHLGGTLRLADIEDLPGGATIVGDDQQPVVNCVEPTVQPDEEEAVAGAVEPEVIGRSEDEEAEAP